MTKKDIINKVFENLKKKNKHIPKTQLKNIIEALFDQIIEGVAKGDKIEVRGLGTFKVRRRRSRIVVNPKTGISSFIQERYIPYFKISKTFKKALNKK